MRQIPFWQSRWRCLRFEGSLEGSCVINIHTAGTHCISLTSMKIINKNNSNPINGLRDYYSVAAWVGRCYCALLINFISKKCPPKTQTAKTLCEHLPLLLLGMEFFMTNSFGILYPHFTIKSCVFDCNHLLRNQRITKTHSILLSHVSHWLYS